MCVVSMITDHWQKKYPNVPEWTWIEMKDYLELVRKAQEYDKKMNQPDCPSPEKDAFNQSIIRRLEELERQMKK